MLTSAMATHAYVSDAALWGAMRAAWDSIALSKVRSCVKSMSDRLSEIVDSSGAMTHY